MLCAGAADMIADEVRVAVAELAAIALACLDRTGLPSDSYEKLFGSNGFRVPVVYEGRGIVNLEASRAQWWPPTSARVQVVADGITGSLVHYAPLTTGYQARLAGAVNALVADPATAERYGRRTPALSGFSGLIVTNTGHLPEGVRVTPTMQAGLS